MPAGAHRTLSRQTLKPKVRLAIITLNQSMMSAGSSVMENAIVPSIAIVRLMPGTWGKALNRWVSKSAATVIDHAGLTPHAFHERGAISFYS